MPELSLLHLNENELARAYPLIRSDARVSPERWEAFGRELIAGGGGIIAVEAGDACLHGVAAFRRLGSLRHELSLQVEILIAFELSHAAPVRRALCVALEDLARKTGCGSIVFTTAARTCADPRSRGRLAWERLGLQMETVGFVRQLRPLRPLSTERAS